MRRTLVLPAGKGALALLTALLFLATFSIVFATFRPFAELSETRIRWSTLFITRRLICSTPASPSMRMASKLAERDSMRSFSSVLTWQ